MKSFDIPLAGLFLLLTVQLMGTFPLHNTALTTDDMDVLKLLLQQLEESIPVSSQDRKVSQVDEKVADLEEILIQPQTKMDMRQHLSARDLKTVRQDSKRSSGCFGRRLDRIGSMSSLGCNTVRSSPKRK
ncbi:brain natriuretic peptide-like [Xyrauchen texanus]|uniref:brain natriuretic peptide-like n=1 Tax=Xyrauchen texanus TaxID=154827 RepID=UPI002242398B|nr:brain natriuretic peptide-like [Xyrauchen texanus]